MPQAAGWESLPRPVVALIGGLALLFALPFVGLTILSLFAIAYAVSEAREGIVTSLFAAFLGGIIAFALSAVAWRMLRAAIRGPEA